MSAIRDDIELTITVDGSQVTARPGDTLAAVMLKADIRAMRLDKRGQPRGLFCNMGTCFECVVTLGDGKRVRSCMTDVTPGMSVLTGKD